MKNELETKVEEIKKDADVQRALKQATTAEPEEVPKRARLRDKLVIGTHLVMLVGLGVVHQLIELKFSWIYTQYPLIRKLLAAVVVAVVCLMILRLVEVYFIGRVGNTVQQYNLGRVARLVVWLVIAFFALTILFQNWYTAVVSFGLISLILGFALQTPITSLTGCNYRLWGEPSGVGDRTPLHTEPVDVIDVAYLDTTPCESAGDYLSTEHPSERALNF